MMDLYERDIPRKTIQSAFDRVRGGEGAVVLVSGEAGIGKTSFVTDFTRRQREAVQVLWGACDPFFTPRPLGPVYDIAVRSLPHLLELLNAGADWLSTAASLHKTLLERAIPAVLVFEDVHWADEATMDLIKYLCRRVHQMKTLIVLTYREDEITGQHPLRSVLGALPARSTVRLRLEPLSAEAVEDIARKMNRSSKGIYEVTRGNPFFVTEVLRSDNDAISPAGQLPMTVRDAVLARVTQLSTPARDVLNAASIFPGQAEFWLLNEIIHPEAHAVDACIENGFLLSTDDALVFRHELARLAIESALPVSFSKELHHKALAALRRSGETIPLARLVHHAARAGDAQMVLEYGPRAAEQASRQGAHREAALYYQTALPYRRLVSVEEQARLLDQLSFELYLTGQIDPSIQVRHDAAALWQKAGESERVGDAQRWLSRLYWFQGTKDMADRYAVEAISTLEQIPPGKALAMAYSTRSQLHMLAEENDAAVEWGMKALKLAESLQETEITVHALTNIGTAELIHSLDTGQAKLEQALQLALEHEMHDHASRCYVNLTSRLIENRLYARAEGYLAKGLTYTLDRDLSSYSVYLLGMQARFHFEQGRWAEALLSAQEVQRLQPGSAIIAMPGITTLGYILARQGNPEAWRWLDEALELALPNREFQRMGPLSIARAEAAWWSGHPERVLPELQRAVALAGSDKEPFLLGAIAYWSTRAGGEAFWFDHIPPAYQAMIRGDWRSAAEEWRATGCPFEQALALSDGNLEAQRQALAIFDQLGAKPAARLLREKLLRQGVRGLPRGARPSTRANPQGLTSRETDILALVEEGLSNAAIAKRLSISPKTVDHHVSSILSKLQARSRGEAAALARKLNIL